MYVELLMKVIVLVRICTVYTDYVHYVCVLAWSEKIGKVFLFLDSSNTSLILNILN